MLGTIVNRPPCVCVMGALCIVMCYAFCSFIWKLKMRRTKRSITLTHSIIYSNKEIILSYEYELSPANHPPFDAWPGPIVYSYLLILRDWSWSGILILRWEFCSDIAIFIAYISLASYSCITFFCIFANGPLKKSLKLWSGQWTWFKWKSATQNWLSSFNAQLINRKISQA